MYSVQYYPQFNVTVVGLEKHYPLIRGHTYILFILDIKDQGMKLGVCMLQVLLAELC
jgi:hypothetical protein